MSNLLRDNCGDTYVTGDMTGRGWSGAASSIQTGRFGTGGAIRINNATLSRSHGSQALGSQLTYHLGFRPVNLANQQDIINVREGVTIHATVRINQTTGTLAITRAGTTVLGTTAAQAAFTNTWAHLMLVISVHDTTGTAELWINGVQLLDLSGLDTRNGGAGTVDTLGLFGNGTSNVDFDDLHVWSGRDLKGDTRVIGSVVNGAGASAQYTPSASTNISNVDDAAQDGDTTYNASSTAGHRDSFTAPATGLGAGSVVYWMGALAVARKDDAAARTLALSARRGTTYYDTTPVAMGSSYSVVDDGWEQDPSTGAAWTLANAEAAQLGYLNG